MQRLEMERMPLSDPQSGRPSLNWPMDQDPFTLSPSAGAAGRGRVSTRMWLIALSIVAGAAMLLAIVALALSVAAGDQAAERSSLSSSGSGYEGIRRIAFGSCTSYDLRPQPIWTQAVIPSQPDAWVWLGDMAYMDDQMIDCAMVPTFPGCNCTADWLHRPPYQCSAGDPEHARMRMAHQLANPGYQAFLNHSCPNAAAASGSGAPPDGSDPATCPRPIFGIYDDHDYGWNNGDSRHPTKAAIKGIYLDALGAPQGSPRRSGVAGAQWLHRLNKGSGGQEIDLLLLDGRWYRDTMPCSMRQEYCAAMLADPTTASAGNLAWCKDFLLTGGPGGGGSCCRKDDEWGQWCNLPSSPSHPSFPELCDPTQPGFAATPQLLVPDNSTVLPASPELWAFNQSTMWRRMVEGADSPLCEVLGREQREWLVATLEASTAPLVLVASGSVVAGGLGITEGTPPRTCSGDDWLCYSRAQVNFLHSLARSTAGCVVILTGDYHYSDMKAILPGSGTAYHSMLRTDQLTKPLYQVMSSGLTESTAQPTEESCEDTFRDDLVGLRPLGRCALVTQAAFGMVEVDWDARIAELSIRNGSTGEVARDRSGVAQLLRLSLDSCKLLP